MVRPPQNDSLGSAFQLQAACVPFMREIFTSVQFSNPVFFWLLLTLPLLWFRLRDRRLVVLIWRTGILLLLVLTLADPQTVSQQTKDEERIFAFDLSESISPTMRRWMERTALDQLAPNRQEHVFVFGSEVK